MSHGFAHSRNIYRQGNSFFDYYTQANIGMGNSSTKYSNIAGTQKSDLTDGTINVDYNYYILDYLALGAEVQYGNSVNDPKNSNYKFTANSWNIMPMLTLNAPVKNGWNNTFLRLGAGFGQLKITVDDSGTKTTQKDKLTNYGGWLGYNDFIAEHLSLAPMIGYQWITDKDNDTKVKVKARGIDLRLGIRYHL